MSIRTAYGFLYALFSKKNIKPINTVNLIEFDRENNNDIFIQNNPKYAMITLWQGINKWNIDKTLIKMNIDTSIHH